MSTYMSALNQLRDADLAALGAGWNMRASLEAPAKTRWLSLRSFSSNPQECELREAGVSERRITLLYNPEFEDLMPKLTSTIDGTHYLHLDGREAWQTKQEGICYLHVKMSTPIKAAADFDKFRNTAPARALRDHIVSCLPVGQLDIKRASAMVESLWRAHWVMANIKDSEEPLEELYYQFTAVCDWVLPNLVPEVS